MKKLIPIFVVGVLVLSGLGAVALNVEKESNTKSGDPENLGDPKDYTHTVFAEVGTGQFCGPCSGWNSNIYSTFSSGQYDFQYIMMIAWGHGGWNDILNSKAYSWKNLYGISSIPTTIFDGDYQSIVGNSPTQLPGALDACGQRIVKDIDASMSVSWLGNAQIKIDIQIQNNEATQYDGYIRVPISEIISRYTTSTGSNYYFAFLDYAFPMNTAISISPYGSYTNSVTWDGNQHQDNHGNNFGDIAKNNIKVFLSVFNNNGYVDETTYGYPQGPNFPPDTPSISGPTSGIVDVAYEFTASTTDPDGDDVYYYFDWGDNSNSGWVGPYGSGDTGSVLHSWNNDGTYFVKVKAKDIYNDESSFSNSIQIQILPNNNPYTPSNPSPYNGETDVDINADLGWTGGDPDGDTVYYDVYFGTNSNPPLLASGITETNYDPQTMDPGETYYWQIEAIDEHGSSTTGPVWSFTTSVNNPPNTPSNPSPSDGAIDVDINAILSWTCSDPDGDTLYYDVYLEEDDQTPDIMVYHHSLQNYYDPPGQLELNTHYYWKIVAWDQYGASNSGPVWDFITGDEPNNPPDIPSNPSPENGANEVDVEIDLSWTCSDPDGDALFYDVYFEADDPDPDVLVSDDQTSTTYDPGKMQGETTYYWQIIVKDEHGASIPGPVWNFTTEESPNEPPGAPTIDGEENGNSGTEYEYGFTSIDFESDDIAEYIINWGDTKEETITGPFLSGEKVYANHSWSEQGTYIITAKAKDINGLVGPEGTLSITMPVNQHYYSFPLIQRLLERFPNAFPILRYLLGL